MCAHPLSRSKPYACSRLKVVLILQRRCPWSVRIGYWWRETDLLHVRRFCHGMPFKSCVPHGLPMSVVSRGDYRVNSSFLSTMFSCSSGRRVGASFVRPWLCLLGNLSRLGQPRNIFGAMLAGIHPCLGIANVFKSAEDPKPEDIIKYLDAWWRLSPHTISE